MNKTNETNLKGRVLYGGATVECSMFLHDSGEISFSPPKSDTYSKSNRNAYALIKSVVAFWNTYIEINHVETTDKLNVRIETKYSDIVEMFRDAGFSIAHKDIEYTDLILT